MPQSWRGQGYRLHSFTPPLLGRIELCFKDEREVENASWSPQALFVPKAGDQFCQRAATSLSTCWTKGIVISIDKSGLFSSLVLCEMTHIKVFMWWKHIQYITADLSYSKYLWCNPSTKGAGFFTGLCNTSNFSYFPSSFHSLEKLLLLLLFGSDNRLSTKKTLWLGFCFKQLIALFPWERCPKQEIAPQGWLRHGFACHR